MKLFQNDHSLHRAAVGELIYLVVSTRPNVSFPVSYLARNVQDLTVRHLWQLKCVLRYICGTKNKSIKCRRSEEGRARDIQAFSDADWAGCIQNRNYTQRFRPFMKQFSNIVEERKADGCGFIISQIRVHRFINLGKGSVLGANIY